MTAKQPSGVYHCLGDRPMSSRDGHCFNLVDIGGGCTNGEGSYNGVCHHHQEGPSPWTSVPAPADPEGQWALPDNLGACPQCGASAWRRNGTYAHDLVVLGRLPVQRWQCKACLGSALPLPPGVTARQRPQAFRELVTSMYVHSVSFRGLIRLLDLLGCGVGGRHAVAGRAGGGPRSGVRPAGAAAVVGRGGRNLAVPRRCQAARGRGPGPPRALGWICA